MSQTLDQIFIANPAASLLSTDLIYLSRSPYTPGNDFGITAANFITSSLAGAVLLAPSGNQNITAHNLFLSAGGFISGAILGPQGAATTATIQAVAPGGAASLIAASYVNTSGSAPTYWNYKSRSAVVGSFVTVQTNDVVGRNLYYADDGTSFVPSASVIVNAVGTISTGIVPGAYTINTANASGSLTFGLAIDSSQLVTTNNLFSNVNVQSASQLIAGQSSGGNNGALILYPATTATGSFGLSPVANALTHASTTAARTWTLPDASGTIALTGSSSSGYVLLAPGAPQTITGFGLTLPNLNTTGNVTAGLGAGGSPGSLISFPTTTGKGSLIVAASDNATGSFNTTITNALAYGQSQVITIPNAGATTANFVLAPSALVSGNIPKASGTAGLIIDSGIAASALATTASASAWTPVATFQTPGDLSVSYAVQSGNYVKVGNMVVATFQITFTPTYTTAAGDLTITGLTVTPANNAFCSVNYSGITLTTLYTNILANAQSDGIIYIYQNGSTQTRVSLSVTQLTSGNAYSLYATIVYMA